MDLTKSFETPYMRLEIRESIMFCTYREDINIDLTTAKEIVQQRLAFIDGREYPVLVDGRNAKAASKEARDYLAKGPGIKGVTAIAIVVENLVPAVLANLYLTFSRPPVPAKIFNDHEKALQWLRQFAE